MKLRVLKFGGSSVSDAQRIESISKIVSSYQKDSIKVVLVLSAVGKTTSQLIEAGISASTGKDEDISEIQNNHSLLIKNLGLTNDVEMNNSVKDLFNQCSDVLKGVSLIKELSVATQDVVMSFGERISVRIVASYLNHIGIKAIPLDAYDIGIVTKGKSHGSSTKQLTGAQLVSYSHGLIEASLKEHLSNTVVPVITGFIAKNEANRLVTLGRGGSDMTASIVGSALQVDVVEIWTDTHGVLTGDPKVVDNPKTIPYLSFAQASELAYFGAKVLHPRTIQPAMESNIPVCVRNSYEPDHPGTIISIHASEKNKELPIVGLTLKSPVMLIDIRATQMMGQHGFMSEIFSVFSRFRISVDVIATSEISVSVTLDKDTELEHIHEVQQLLKQIATVEIIGERSIVTLIGNGNKPTTVLQRTFTELEASGVEIEMVSLSASKLNTSIVMSLEHGVTALRTLHKSFFS